MRKTLVDRFRNWLAADEGRPVPRARGAAAGQRMTDAPPLSDSERYLDLELRLKQLVAQPQMLAAGRVHMINLDSLRLRLGDAWPQLQGRVHMAADRVIRRHLSERDVQFRSSEGEYIVVFAELDRSAASLVCAKIAEELHRHFLGDPDLSEVTVGTAVSMVDGRLLYQNASVADLLMNVEISTARAEDDAEEEEAAAVRPAPAAAEEAPEPRSFPSFADQSFEQIQMLYRPVWDVQQKVISTYMCVPVRRFPDGSAIEGTAALAPITDPQRLAEISINALADSMEILDELFRNKFRLVVSVPVSFETLAVRKSRQEYVGYCRSLPDYLRPFVAFEFMRFPRGVPNGRMTELVNELRPYCRWTFLQVDLKQTSFAPLAGTGLTGVSALVPSDRNAEARTMADLNAFAAGAEKAGLRSSFVGIASASLAVAARAAGATFIAGDRIGKAEEIPQNMLRFGWQDLFMRNSDR